MGYEIHFKPSEKKMEEYKPWGFDKPSYESASKRVEETRLELLTYCLRSHKDEGCYKVNNQIRFYLNLLMNELEQEEKESAYKRWLEEEDHDLWYCGWEFAHSSYHDSENTLQACIEDLVILAYVVDTPDYFEKNDGFYEKRKAITERLDDFIDTISNIIVHKIIDDLDEFKEPDDYDDLKEDKEKDSNDEANLPFGKAIRTEEDIKKLFKIDGKVEINPVETIVEKVKEHEKNN